ncbi:MAG: Fur family transcriptional regulator [Opitutaceae bacterium]
MSIPPAREKFQSYLQEKGLRPPPIPPAALDGLFSFLNHRGLRLTNQRMGIFAAAFSQKEHFTAEQLLEQARAIDDSVSRATVYRTLPIMTGSAVLREVDIGSGEKFYRSAVGGGAQVAQVICLDCDRIFEISAPFMEWYGTTVSSKLDLTPVTQRLQVSARCDVLRRTGSCPRRP